LSGTSPYFTEREDSLLSSHNSAIFHHPVSGEHTRNFTPYLSKIHFNIILPSKPISLTISLPLKISRLSLGCGYVLQTYSASCVLDHPRNIQQYKLRSSPLIVIVSSLLFSKFKYNSRHCFKHGPLNSASQVSLNKIREINDVP
jgi:hypothetical protein